MARRKASKGKKSRAKAARGRTTARRKVAKKATRPKKAAARRATPDASRRIAELQAENRRLRDELDRLRGERSEETAAEAQAEAGGEDEDDIPTLGL
jgi:hypothetical protein